jgi:hypothetical protein
VKVSVIVPTRLAKNPESGEGNLWLDRALSMVKRQTVKPVEVVVCPGEGDRLPERFSDVIYAAGNSQAHAMNRGARKSTGDVIAFLEDDDYWEPRWLEYALAAIDSGYSIVTGSQREVDTRGGFIRYNDYPSPSGWVMRRSTWNALGGVDESYRWHLDNEFLGKATKANERRVHLVENDAPPRPWLVNVAKRSAVAKTGEREPLIVRTRNPAGGMERIAREPELAAQSQAEYARLVETYGEVPW